MAVLGSGGLLKFYRDPPEVVTVTSDAIDTATNSLEVLNPSLWSGDQVEVASVRGVPFNLTTGGLPDPSGFSIPDCPDGYAFYAGSKWLAGGARTHVIDNNSKFYKLDNTAPFYVRNVDVGYIPASTFYIYRDQLDRISFYETRSAALRGHAEDRIPIYNVDFDTLTLTYQDPKTWTVQANIQEWSLNLQAAEQDITALGDRFTSATKILLSGSGSLDFLIERKDNLDRKDSTYLLNLLLMTENDCKTDAQFWMIENRPEGCADLLPGDLFYQTTLILTNIAISTRPDALIAGSAEFVTVGAIGLRMGES